jgi:hypothetical protein
VNRETYKGYSRQWTAGAKNGGVRDNGDYTREDDAGRDTNEDDDARRGGRAGLEAGGTTTCLA